MSLTAKKFSYVLVSFLSLPLWIPRENRAKLKKLFNLNCRLSWRANISDTQNTLIFILIKNCRNASDFLN